MHQLVYYEFRKIIANGKSCMLLIGIVVCNLLIGIMASWGNDSDLMNRKWERGIWEQQLESGGVSLNNLSEQVRQYGLFQRIFIYSQQEWEEQLLALVEEDPGILSEYEECMKEMDIEDIMLKHQVIEDILEQHEYFNDYTAFREQISIRAEQMQTVSIWGDVNGYSNRNIVKTAADFTHLEVNLELGSGDGIDWVGTGFWTDWIILLSILFLGIILFKWEKENDALRLMASCRDGRFRSGTAKLIVIVLFSIILAVILYGTNILLAGWLYGYGSMTRSVQSVSSFQNCGINLTVGEYLVCFVLGKMVSLACLALLMCLSLMIFPGILIPTAGLLAVLIVEYLLYIKIGIHSPLRILRYWNLFTFTDLYELIRNYQNFNVFGYPVNIMQGWFVFSGLILILIPAVLLILFVHNEITQKKGDGATGRISGLAALKYRLMPSLFLHSRWYWEIRNYLVRSGGLLLVVCGLAGCFILTSGEERLMGLSSVEAECEEWVCRYAGEVTAEKEAEIEAWNIYFETADELRQEIEERYAAGELTQAQRDGKLWILERNMEKQGGFQMFYLLYEMAGREHGIVSRDAIGNLFRENRTKQLVDIFLMIWSVLMASMTLMPEYRNRVIYLVRSTEKKGRTLFFVRSLSCLLLVWFLVGMRMYWRCMVWSETFSFGEWDISIRSVVNLWSAGAECSILQYIVLTGILQAVGMSGVCMSVIALAVYMGQAQRAFLAGTVLFVIPCALNWIGLKLPIFFGIQDLLSMEIFWERQGSIWLQVGTVLVVMASAALIWCVAWKRFCVDGRQPKEEREVVK